MEWPCTSRGWLAVCGWRKTVSSVLKARPLSAQMMERWAPTIGECRRICEETSTANHDPFTCGSVLFDNASLDCFLYGAIDKSVRLQTASTAELHENLCGASKLSPLRIPQRSRRRLSRPLWP